MVEKYAQGDQGLLLPDLKHVVLLTGRKAGGGYEFIDSSELGTALDFRYDKPEAFPIILRPKF